MLRGIIRGNIVSTRKQESLVGSKFMEVEIMKNGVLTGEYLIAVDSVGAGIGETVLITTGSSARLALHNTNETVLITTGSSARLALHNTNAPCDAVIVGIVD